jgi:hypothetical protein
VDLENVLKVNAYPQLRKNIPAASQGQTNWLAQPFTS